jgi:hypothetical protein
MCKSVRKSKGKVFARMSMMKVMMNDEFLGCRLPGTIKGKKEEGEEKKQEQKRKTRQKKERTKGKRKREEWQKGLKKKRKQRIHL